MTVFLFRTPIKISLKAIFIQCSDEDVIVYYLDYKINKDANIGANFKLKERPLTLKLMLVMNPFPTCLVLMEDLKEVPI